MGAGNEIRTRDLNLGKVALYQLSYSRIRYVCATVVSRELATLAARPHHGQGCALPTELFPRTGGLMSGVP